MEDPTLRRLWNQGRYEIINGVLSVMPAAFFIGGESAATLAYLLRSYLSNRKILAHFSSEADVQISPTDLVRADIAAVIGDDLVRFKAVKFPDHRIGEAGA